MSDDDETMKAPESAAAAFAKIYEACGLDYPSFTVMKQAERDIVLRCLTRDEINTLVKAVNEDERKINVQRVNHSAAIARAVKLAQEAGQPCQGTVVDQEEVELAIVATAQPADSNDRPQTPTDTVILLPAPTSSPPPSVSPATAEFISARPSYVGIINQGNTCYLNSMMQALFHVPYFRSMMMYRVSANCTDPIPTALRNLFMQLELRSSNITTKELTSAFGWNAEEAARQHDVHELAQVLFDSLESILKNTPDKDAIKMLFYGSQTYYTRCLDAEFTSRRKEGLYDIELIVKGQDSLTSSFDFYVRPEKIDGKYCWEHDDGSKTYHEAERGVLFDRLPPVLMIHPNRVDFDMERMERITVSNRWTFPVEIDLGAYITPPGASSSLESLDRQESFGELQSSEYVLRSVVIHSGTPAYGHYYCYVRLEDGRWVCFNDNTVSHVAESTVFSKAFGGMVAHSSYSYPSSERATLLIYLNKSAIEKLLFCPQPDEAALRLACEEIERSKIEREAAERLERCKITVNYVVFDEEGDYLVYLEDGKADQQCKPRTVKLIQGFSKEKDQDLAEEIAKQLNLSASDIQLWTYQYLPLWQTSDGATRYTPPTPYYSSYSGYSSYSIGSVKFVQILKKPPQPVPTLPSDVPPSDADGGEGVMPTPADPVSSSSSPSPADPPAIYHLRIWNGSYFKYAGVANTKQELRDMVSRVEVLPQAAEPSQPSSDVLSSSEAPPPASWSFFCVANKYAYPVNWSSLATGANVIVAPSYMPSDDCVKHLLRKVETEVDIVRLGYNGSLSELFRAPFEAKATLDTLQKQIFGKLVELGFPAPASPDYIGIREYDHNTNGPKSSLAHSVQYPFYSSFYNTEQKTTLQSLLKTTVNKLYVDFLPIPMSEVDKKPYNNIHFSFSMNYHRYVLIDGAVTSFEEIQAEALRQWQLDPEAPVLPEGSTLRILSLDYWGKLKVLSMAPHMSLLRHETYILDVVLPPPVPPVGEPDVQPLLVNVQHVNRYSGETFFGKPTNTYIFPQSERETGEVILLRTLDKLGVVDASQREQALKTWKVCIKSLSGVKVLGRAELLKSILPADGNCEIQCLMLDHIPQGTVKAASREHAIQIRHSPVPQN